MSFLNPGCALCWEKNCNCSAEDVAASIQEAKDKAKLERDQFNDWFGDLLLSQPTCLLRDVLRDSKEELFTNWKVRKP